MGTEDPAKCNAIAFPLRNPEPNSLEDVSWNLLRPLTVLGIECSLASRDIGISWVDKRRLLEDLPESIEDEEYWDAKIGGEEIWKKSEPQERRVFREDLPVMFQ